MNVKHILTSLYSISQIRLIEQALFATHPSYSVMYYAGVSVFEYLLNHYQGRAFHIVLGSGNNAGDGMVLAGLLKQSGQTVYGYRLFDKPFTGDALLAEEFANKHHVEFLPIDKLPIHGEQDVLVDAIFGIGFRGELSIELQAITKQLNRQTFYQVIAIDIASGLNADTGKLAKNGMIVDKTLTLIGHKPGFYFMDGVRSSGTVSCFTLGATAMPTYLYRYTFDRQCDAKLDTKPTNLGNQNKSDFGHLLVVGGGEGMFGAAALSSMAGLKMGAGKVSVYTHPTHCHQYQIDDSHLFEVMRLTDERKIKNYQTLCLGPGLGRDEWAKSTFDCAIRQTSIVIDADGLYWLAQANDIKLSHNAIITPHEAEAARLLHCSVEKIRQDKVTAVKALANYYGCIAVLKGAGTLVSDGENIYINSTGNVCLASAGTGDVLAGMIAGLLATGHSALEAAMLGVYLHGLAADNYYAKHQEKTLRASDLFNYLSL